MPQNRQKAKGAVTATAWALALSWGVLPALPALLRGDLIGHGLTDLYMQVWGMWWLGTHAPSVPLRTDVVRATSGVSDMAHDVSAHTTIANRRRSETRGAGVGKTAAK